MDNGQLEELLGMEDEHDDDLIEAMDDDDGGLNAIQLQDLPSAPKIDEEQEGIIISYTFTVTVAYLTIIYTYVNRP